jgi:chromosomal replication initiation ATPase DnaA
MTKETYIAECIMKLYDINVYDNRRTKEIVEYRSLMCYILHKDLNLTLYKVRDHFNNNGKQMSHCNVHHNVKLFEKLRAKKTHLNELRFEILGSIDPKYLLLKRIENIEDKEKIEQITNCINHYE